MTRPKLNTRRWCPGSIQPGQSALFVLSSEATPDRVIAALRPYGGEIIHTNLSVEDEAKLKAVFGAEEA